MSTTCAMKSGVEVNPFHQKSSFFGGIFDRYQRGSNRAGAHYGQIVQGCANSSSNSKIENQRSKSSIPNGLSIYAVGDVHGRMDLLRVITRNILTDANSCIETNDFRIIFLGDYIDKGANSYEVISYLISLSQELRPRILCLKGNHEQALLDFLQNPQQTRQWLVRGGDATLYSYGVSYDRSDLSETGLQRIASELARKIPSHHMNFYQSLPTHVVHGDYMFVHAGVRPGLRLNQQTDMDLMTIRREFLDHEEPWEKVVVHGHSMTPAPYSDGRRICVDTGAYASGRLSGVKLHGAQRSFFHASISNRP